ncbi:site-specific DNA-methyltransferase [Aerococcus vaginalis]
MNSFWNDSLTQYENKIGLTINGKYLDEKTDIVLDFPYKDTILKASMSKEDLDKDELKPEEPFLNELIEAEEIDQLLDKKILVNAKRYSSGKAEKAVNLSDTDNLILKGNNLIALSSILERYKGKVKCIYIDPPYNTGGDSFNYNDRFNRSTWLTFMKNRLEISKGLLRDDGVIFVSLSDEEAHYCKVLMDEIFGENNFLNDIIWNSTKSVTNTAIISVSHAHTLTYFRNKDYYVKNRTAFRLPEDSEGFDNPDNDPRGPWKADPFQVGGWRPNQQYEIVNPNTGVSYFPNEGNSWKNDYKKFKELVKDNRIVFGVNGTAGPQRKRFLSEAKERGRVAKTIWDDLGTTTNGTQHMKQLFGKAVFKNPKPEQFIRRIIELATEPDDIILDFFVGSGTTCSTAHKMGRRYIGIEQMNYIKDITLKKWKKLSMVSREAYLRKLTGKAGVHSYTQN